MLIAKIRYWLARHICRRYAREYRRAVDDHGLEWTLTLIDEDQYLYGAPSTTPWRGPASSTTPKELMEAEHHAPVHRIRRCAGLRRRR